jgi:membrane associated rhomboid family serine protease
MASGPDLFVICKNCSAEVSPYITECPYCGARLRKRAPKLDKKSGRVKEPKPRRPRLGPLRKGEIPGIRTEHSRPYGTIALVLASIVVTLLFKSGLLSPGDIVLGFETDPWRTVTTLFIYSETGYELIALSAVFLFGWLLERRHGIWAPLLVFLAGGAAGNFLVIGADEGAVSVGANGAALALLCAWAVRPVLARRRGLDDETDLLGVLAFGVVLLLLPLASTDAHSLAGLGGALAGIVLGLLLARLRER